MTLIDDIARMEAAAKSHFVEAKKASREIDALQDEYNALLVKMDEEDRSKIVLDPSLDPDPHGCHGFPLTYRLKCMGWP